MKRDRIKPLPGQPATGQSPETPGETGRILENCTECGACVKACHFLKHYCDSPMELARRFTRNPLESIEIPYSCSLCGLCRQVCRQDLFPGGMCQEARGRIFQPLVAGDLPDEFVYDFVTPRLKGIRNHQILSTSPFFALNRPPRARGSAMPKRVFFPGCS